MLMSGLAVIALLGFGAWAGLRPVIASFNQPTDYPGPGTGQVQVVVPDGASGQAIGQVLQTDGVVLSVKGFVQAYSNNPRSSSIQPGTYRLRRQMTSAAAIDALLTDTNRLLDRVTIKEGARAADLPKLIAAKTEISEGDLQAALKDPAAIGLPPEAQGDPEGWLFPATYDVQPNTTATTLLHDMVAKTVAILDAKGVKPADRRTVLVKASLVQAEAKHPQDFGKIARVFDNRLKIGMKLQLDTTVHYATGDFKVATTLKETQVNSPYNTYLHAGLPPGPIDNPGETAIDAVLDPTPGKWLYFVAVNPDTGLTKYAETPGQFAAIKQEYENWAKAHPGR
jgi:UPF0755 protein